MTAYNELVHVRDVRRLRMMYAIVTSAMYAFVHMWVWVWVWVCACICVSVFVVFELVCVCACVRACVQVIQDV